MEEKVFFENGNVSVTNSRFIVGSQTHAMNGVTSVRALRHDPRRGGPIVGLLFGLLLAFTGDGGVMVFGVIIMAVCGFILYSQKPTHAVVLRSSSGETEALTSQDESYIAGVVSALNESIVHRG